jgi:hypothetical protein
MKGLWDWISGSYAFFIANAVCWVLEVVQSSVKDKNQVT